MKLIQEASLDDDFANAMLKVDDGYLKADKLASQFSKENKPVRSQIAMVESAADDFKKLAQKLKDIQALK